MTPDINFQALNVDISSYHCTLHDILLTVILHAINLKHTLKYCQHINLQTTDWTLFDRLSRQHIGNKDVH